MLPSWSAQFLHITDYVCRYELVEVILAMEQLDSGFFLDIAASFRLR